MVSSVLGGNQPCSWNTGAGCLESERLLLQALLPLASVLTYRLGLCELSGPYSISA
jgi:hypothetical protein